MKCEALLKVYNFTREQINNDPYTLSILLRNFSQINSEGCLNDLLLESLNKIKNGNSPIQQIYVLTGLVNLTGRKALNRLEQFWDLIKNSNLDPWTETVTYICLAELYYILGETERVTELIKLAEDRVDEIHDNSDRSDALKRLAILYAKIGKYGDSKRIVSRILYQKRLIEAVLEIVNILLNLGSEEHVDLFVSHLPADWKIVSIAYIANYNFVKGKKRQAWSMSLRVRSTIETLSDVEAKTEAIKKILPILVEFEEIKTVYNFLQDEFYNVSNMNISKYFDWRSLRFLSPSKLLALEIMLMDLETSSHRGLIDRELVLLVLDFILEKDLQERLDNLGKLFRRLSNSDKAFYTVKLSNILAEIHGDKLNC